MREFDPPSAENGWRPAVELPANAIALLATFPCQDVSLLGDRAGLDGERTSLIDSAINALRRRAELGNPVRFVILENVVGLLARSHTPVEREAAVLHILEQVEQLGYAVAYRVVDSIHVAAADGRATPCSRPRVIFVCALRSCCIDPADLLLATSFECAGSCASPCALCCPFSTQLRSSTVAEVHRRATLPWLQSPGVAWDLACFRAHPRLGMLPCMTTSNNNVLVLLSGGKLGRVRLEDAIRMQGVPASFFDCLLSSKRGRGGAAPQLSRSAVWSFLGDALAAQVAFWVADRVSRADQLAGQFDRRLCTELVGGVPADGEAWPSALLSDGDGRRWAVAVGPAPSHASFTPLGQYLTAVEESSLPVAIMRSSAARLHDNGFGLRGPLQRVVQSVLRCVDAASAELEPPARRSQRGAPGREDTVSVVVNLPPSLVCRNCSACRARVPARCLLLDAFLLAGRLHAGAQLTLGGTSSVGTLLRLVSLEKTGTITAFNRETGAHTVQVESTRRSAQFQLWRHDVEVVATAE